MKKVIGICGSPRPQSNTEYYTKYVLEKINKAGIEVEYISLKDKVIGECTGCYDCVSLGKCSIDDDFHEVFQKVMESQGVILASPVYHASITPKLKSFLDRAGFSARWVSNDTIGDAGEYSWREIGLSRKFIAPLVVARKTGHTFAFSQIALWATVNDCFVVGSNYWNIGVAGTGGALDASEDSEALTTMDRLADNFVYLINK